MKLIHLGYYKADYPTLGLAGVDPAAEVEFTDIDKARAVLVEGIFAPGDAASKQLLVEVLTEVELERIAAEKAAAQAEVDNNAAAQAEAEQVAVDQAVRLAAAQADIEAAREAAVKAAKKAAGKVGE